MIAIVVSDKRMERLAQMISQTRVCLTIKKPIDLIDAIKQTEYLEAMKLSVVDYSNILALIENALTDKIYDREIFMKGIDYSYYYEEN